MVPGLRRASSRVCTVLPRRRPHRIACALTNVRRRPPACGFMQPRAGVTHTPVNATTSRRLRPVSTARPLAVAYRLRCVALSARSCRKADRISHTRHCAPPGGAWRHVMTFIARLTTFARDEEGQDLIEYALLVGL